VASLIFIFLVVDVRDNVAYVDTSRKINSFAVIEFEEILQENTLESSK